MFIAGDRLRDLCNAKPLINRGRLNAPFLYRNYRAIVWTVLFDRAYTM